MPVVLTTLVALVADVISVSTYVLFVACVDADGVALTITAPLNVAFAANKFSAGATLEPIFCEPAPKTTSPLTSMLLKYALLNLALDVPISTAVPFAYMPLPVEPPGPMMLYLILNLDHLNNLFLM